MMELIQVGPEHLDEILAIENQLFSVPWSRTGMMAELENRDVCFAAARVEGRIAGFAVLHSFGDEAELFNIAVSPAFQRRGIGRQLMEKVCRWAEESGVERIFLEVRVSNAAARRLYREYGFENAGLRKGYYDRPKEDAVLMVRHRRQTAEE